MRRRACGLTLALTLTLAATGCSGDGPESTGGDDPGAFSVASALTHLPVPEEESLFLAVADVAAVREANGLEVPDFSDTDEVGDYAISMTGALDDTPAMLSLPPGSELVTPSDQRDTLGFSWMEAEQLAWVEYPPNEFTWTSYDEPVQAADGLTDAGDGVLTPADDAGDPDDPLLVFTDGSEAVTSRSSADLDSWRSDDAPTLADEEDLAAVAAALDGEGVISAYVIRTVGEDDRSVTGVGWALDDGEPRFVIAYGAADEDAADAAVDGLRADYEEPDVAEQLAVDDVTVEGSVVVVTATPVEHGARLLLQMLLNFGLPFDI